MTVRSVTVLLRERWETRDVHKRLVERHRLLDRFRRRACERLRLEPYQLLYVHCERYRRPHGMRLHAQLIVRVVYFQHTY